MEKLTQEDLENKDVLISNNLMARMTVLSDEVLQFLDGLYEKLGISENPIDRIVLPFFLEEVILSQKVGTKMEYNEQMSEQIKEAIRERKCKDACSFDILWGLARAGTDYGIIMDDVAKRERKKI